MRDIIFEMVDTVEETALDIDDIYLKDLVEIAEEGDEDAIYLIESIRGEEE